MTLPIDMQADAPGDAALIAASLRGDHAAFTQIIERYQRTVYAVSYASVRDRALSDDITQDTFVTAWRQLGALRDRDRLPAWLCGIARNLGRDARKRRGREVSVDAPEAIESATPADAITDAECERLVASALDTVDARYREPLVLFYYEQRSVKDVARALGISEQATHQRLSRGRQRLAENVNDLLERGLTRKGPRGDLAVCVLALIGVGASAGHVEASTRTAEGSTMLKIGIAAALVTTVAGAGLLAANSRDAQPRPAASASAKPATAAPPAARPPAPAPAPRAAPRAAPRPTLAPAAAPGAKAAAVDPLTCDVVGVQLAELQLDDAGAKGLPVEKREKMRELVERKWMITCEREAWTAVRRTCVVDAADFTAAEACDPAGPAAPDLSCTGVSKVASRLILPRVLRQATTAARTTGDKTSAKQLVARKATIPKLIASTCETGRWSFDMRECVSKATTAEQADACLPGIDLTDIVARSTP